MCKGEVCGACTGALMALGLKFGQSDIDDMESRKKTNDITVEFLNLFRKENNVSQVLFKRFSKRVVFKKG